MKNKEKFKMGGYDESHREDGHEDKANSTSLIMDNIVRSPKELEERQNELGNKIDGLVANMHKLFKNILNRVDKDPKEHGLEETKINNEDRNEVTVAYNSNVYYDKTPEKKYHYHQFHAHCRIVGMTMCHKRAK